LFLDKQSKEKMVHNPQDLPTFPGSKLVLLELLLEAGGFFNMFLL
jgi:hypothetical protein